MGCQQHAWPAHAPEQVEAEVNYIRDNGQRPVAYTYPAPAGTPQRSALLQPTRVAIRNARLLAQPASLEREGFQLVREASAVGDFEDEAQVRERYYPESIALLRRLTGAAEAVIFDHTLRVDQAGREERGLREPVRYVHNDQTLRSAPRRVRDH
ncbi:CmcJ/NvfI family oxidoreductase, partial [Pseudomonas aeruginosa]